MNTEMKLLYLRTMLDRRFFEAALLSLDIDIGACIVDVGCGPGASTQVISSCFPEAKIIGIDKSLEAITHARQFLGNADINFVCAEAENIPYDNESFDCCVAKMLLDISPNVDEILQELIRLVKPHGYILLYGNTRTTADGNILPRHTNKLINAYNRYVRLTRWKGFNVDYIVDFLKKHNMKVKTKKIIKDVINPGRENLLAYYSVKDAELKSFSENNLLAKLHLIQPQEIIEYEKDLQELLLRADSYLSFEQAVIIAQRRENDGI